MKDPTHNDSLEHYFSYNIQLYLSKVNAVNVTPTPSSLYPKHTLFKIINKPNIALTLSYVTTTICNSY